MFMEGQTEWKTKLYAVHGKAIVSLLVLEFGSSAKKVVLGKVVFALLA